MFSVVVRHSQKPISYKPVLEAMKLHVKHRMLHQSRKVMSDEFWFLEHEPVYTLGIQKNPQNLLSSRGIPVVFSDRGGQITYHAPGQWMLYTLLDLERMKLTPSSWVHQMESICIQALKRLKIKAHIRGNEPGVYVLDEKMTRGYRKIASIGLRVKRGIAYHGLALNVAMDLSPFLGINPCGFSGLKMTEVREFSSASMFHVKRALLETLLDLLYPKEGIRVLHSREFPFMNFYESTKKSFAHSG